MIKISKPLTNRERLQQKCTFVRFLVIVLSFVSLLSRVIYATYATWLTITTFDCIPCPNGTAFNASSHLFVSHHSSATFKTVRDLDIKTKANIRTKRSEELNDLLNESKVFAENYSKFSSISDDFDEIRLKAEKLANEGMKELVIELSAEPNSTEPKADTIELRRKTIQRAIDRLFSNISKDDGLYGSELKPDSQPIVSEQTLIGRQLENQFINKSFNSLEIPIQSSSDGNTTNETLFERFTYIPSNDVFNIVEDLINTTNDTEFEYSMNENNSSDEWSGFKRNMSNETNVGDNSTMTVLLDPKEFNTSIRQQKSLNDDIAVNDTFNLSSVVVNDININVCSEDCSQFLAIELSDPSVRKWATIVITGVLYLYAFVMFCIFIGSVLAIVDLLVISTFIEGAKLFAGFVLIIIDSFNGKEVHFNLIDVKFNVQRGGNGWTADFEYSEYLLDIIIFFLSTYLCIRVFKCFEKRPKRIASIEELAETRGTYRSNASRNSLQPIFEQN